MPHDNQQCSTSSLEDTTILRKSLSAKIVAFNKAGSDLFLLNRFEEAFFHYKLSLDLIGNVSQVGVENNFEIKHHIPLHDVVASIWEGQNSSEQSRIHNLTPFPLNSPSDCQNQGEWERISTMIVIYNISLLYFVSNNQQQGTNMLELVLHLGGCLILVDVNLNDERPWQHQEDNSFWQSALVVHLIISVYHLLGLSLYERIQQLNNTVREQNSALSGKSLHVMATAIDLGETRLGNKHPRLASLLITVGYILFNAGYKVDARNAFGRARNISQQAYHDCLKNAIQVSASGAAAA